MLKLKFHGSAVTCEACGSELFEEVIDDHCQIFRCTECGGFIAFGNTAIVERIRVHQARGDNDARW